MEIQGYPERVRLEKVFCYDYGLLNDCKNLKYNETDSAAKIPFSRRVAKFFSSLIP